MQNFINLGAAIHDLSCQQRKRKNFSWKQYFCGQYKVALKCLVLAYYMYFILLHSTAHICEKKRANS